MPLYEYQCDACGHRFEVIQKFSDLPPASCQKCTGVVNRLPSSPAIQFKGSGFYITDYARAGKSDAGTSSEKGDGKASAAGKGESTSDSKPEARTESAKDSKTESKSESKPAAATPSTS
jgi:putative FmdB family regulatory protein